MQASNTSPQPTHWSIQATVSLVLLSAVFAFDLMQPLGVAAGVPYAAVVMAGIFMHSRKLIITLAGLGSALTLLGLYLQQADVDFSIVATNRILAILLIWATAFLCARQLRFQETVAEHFQKTQHDPLTSLPNRTNLFNRGEMLLLAARKREQNISLIAFGIDDLQKLTDEQGSLAADAAIQHIAELFNRRDKQHYVANLASGVFVLILPGVNLDFAIQHSKTLLQDAAQLNREWEGKKLPLSLSAGVCQATSEMASIVDFFRTAEDALRKAKKLGGNQIAVAGQ